MFAELQRLRDGGANVYYDEGISPGHEWTQELADAIDGSSQFLYFVSQASVASRHCRNEVRYALDQGKPVVSVHLEPTVLPGGLQLALGSTQAILRYDLGAEGYERKLLRTFALSKSPVDQHGNGSSHRRADSGQRRLVAGAVVAALLLTTGAWWTQRDDGSRLADRLQYDSIAILPFSDVGTEKHLAPLADLITRQLISRLDALPAPNVASLVAIEPLINQGLSLREIGQRLETPIMLVGYLQAFSGQIEVPVEIVRSMNGRVLWSETLRRRNDDTELTARFVAGELSRFLWKLSTTEQPGPSSPEAYRAWLNWHFHQANYRNWEEIKWIEQVIMLEPGYSEGHLDAYLSYSIAAIDGRDPHYIERARASLEAASASGLDSNIRFLWSRGTYLTYLVGQLSGGEAYLRQAGLPTYAALLADSGLPEPAIKVFESVTARNPARADGWLGLGFARGMNSDLPGALSAFEEGLERFPDHPYLLLNRNKALIFLGRYDEAERSLERLEDLEPLPPGSHLAVRGNRYWLEGKKGNVEAAILGAELLAKEGWHAVAGQLFLEFGDERAWTEHALAEKDVVPGRRMVSSWLWVNPAWSEHPAVRSYLDSLGFTTAWRKEICRRAIPYVSPFHVQLSCDSA